MVFCSYRANLAINISQTITRKRFTPLNVSQTFILSEISRSYTVQEDYSCQNLLIGGIYPSRY